MFIRQKNCFRLLRQAFLVGVGLYSLNLSSGMVARADEKPNEAEQSNEQAVPRQDCPANRVSEDGKRCRPLAPTFFEEPRKLEPEGFGGTFLTDALNGVGDPLSGMGAASGRLSNSAVIPPEGLSGDVLETQRLQGELSPTGVFTGDDGSIRTFNLSDLNVPGTTVVDSNTALQVLGTPTTVIRNIPARANLSVTVDQRPPASVPGPLDANGIFNLSVNRQVLLGLGVPEDNIPSQLPPFVPINTGETTFILGESIDVTENIRQIVQNFDRTFDTDRINSADVTPQGIPRRETQVISAPGVLIIGPIPDR